MNIKFTVPGNKRKELVKTVAEWLGEKPRYCGAPTFAYEIGGCRIDKEGVLTGGEDFPEETAERLLEHLYDCGFESDISAEETADTENTDSFEISVPIESANCGTLTALIASKEALIKKALGISDTRIIIEEDRVRFPWFAGVPAAEEAHAYAEFIAALCRMSKALTRVNSSEKEVPNEKYAFRCFLLRLGFIGNESKADRKVLLGRLSGSAAFKTEKEAV